MKRSAQPTPVPTIPPFPDLAMALEAITALARRGADVALAQAPGQFTVTVARAPQHLDVAQVIASLSRRLPPARQQALDALLLIQPKPEHFPNDYDRFLAAEEAWQHSLEAFSAASGPGLQPGKLVAWQVADDAAFYVVIEVQPTRTLLRHVPDSYTWEGVGRDGWCPTATVRAQITRQDLLPGSQAEQVL